MFFVYRQPPRQFTKEQKIIQTVRFYNLLTLWQKSKKLILEREEIYSQADHIISSEHRSIQTMAEIIIQKYREADDINR